ncbi:nuclear pore complex protein DDB_G0274915-like isoform X2 [Cotesia glomerata]|uniref:nuclear pore complex protein DDB_G0274915-like isoform X2 n=1 Tax=Cotesia glomerata TaxID=32391 RepID=UPI001D016673|nr:nuclear pore complex protein DDB_G0274915-like isoform X2 [Cotesia glomerata]
MKFKYILVLCLVGVGELASGAKIFGGASIDSQAAGVQAGLTFPKIPGLNSPIFGISILPTASSNNTWDVFNNLFPRILSNDNDSLSSDGNRNGNTSIGQNQQGTTTTSSSNQIETSTTPSSNQNETTTTPSSNQSSTTTQSSVSSFIKRALTSMLPNINSLVPTLRNLTGNITLPSIQGPPSLDSLPQIPGLSDAIAEAREHVRIALNATGDFVDGIETALQQALQSNNPTEAVRTLVNTILNAYLVVAQNCPMIVVGTRVLREGIRLAGEVARSARNIVFGTQ